MNERIRKLAEQARLVPEGQPDGSSPYHDALDDFARLIVEECAGLAGCNGHVSGFALGDLIREHFGIKE